MQKLEIPFQLREGLVNVLTDLRIMETENERRALINTTRIGDLLGPRIDFAGNTSTFLSNFLMLLQSYGIVQGDDDLLIDLLKLISSSRIGADNQRKIDELISSWEQAKAWQGYGGAKGEQKTRKSANHAGPLFDREWYKEKICEHIDGGEFRGLVLWGHRGIGKTVIAKAIVEEYRKKSAPFKVFVAVSYQKEEYVPKGIKTFMSPKDFGEKELYSKIFDAHERPGANNVRELENRIDDIVELMRKNPTLVFIDSFEELIQEGVISSDLYKLLRETPQDCFFLLTCIKKPRDLPTIITDIEVNAFAHEDAVLYLKRITNTQRNPDGESIDDSYYEQIVRAVGRIPLLLNLATPYLSTLPDPEEIVEQINRNERKLPHYLFSRSVGLMTESELKAMAMIAVSRSAVSIKQLQEMARLGNLTQMALSQLPPVEFDRKTKCYSVHPQIRELILSFLESERRELLDATYEAFLKWAVKLIEANEHWEFDTQQYMNLARQGDNLRAAYDLLQKRRDEGRPILGDLELFTLGKTVAHLLHIAGKWSLSEPILKALFNELRNSSDNIKRVMVFKVSVLLGRHYAHLSDLSNAEYYLEEAQRLANDLKDKQLRAEVKLRRGQARHRTAQAQALKMLDYAYKHGNDPTRIAAVGYIAEIYIRRREYQKALDLLEEVADKLNDLGWDRVKAHHARLRAEAYMEMGDYESARLFFDEAETLSRQWAEGRLKGWILLGRAKLDEDIELARKALKIFEGLELQSEIDRTWVFLDKLEQQGPKDDGPTSTRAKGTEPGSEGGGSSFKATAPS